VLGRFGERTPNARTPGVRHCFGLQSEGSFSHEEGDKCKGACSMDLHYRGEASGEATRSDVLALECEACRVRARAAERRREEGLASRFTGRASWCVGVQVLAQVLAGMVGVV
jgi:hypothetical protein